MSLILLEQLSASLVTSSGLSLALFFALLFLVIFVVSLAIRCAHWLFNCVFQREATTQPSHQSPHSHTLQYSTTPPYNGPLDIIKIQENTFKESYDRLNTTHLREVQAYKDTIGLLQQQLNEYRNALLQQQNPRQTSSGSQRHRHKQSAQNHPNYLSTPPPPAPPHGAPPPHPQQVHQAPPLPNPAPPLGPTAPPPGHDPSTSGGSSASTLNGQSINTTNSSSSTNASSSHQQVQVPPSSSTVLGKARFDSTKGVHIFQDAEYSSYEVPTHTANPGGAQQQYPNYFKLVSKTDKTKIFYVTKSSLSVRTQCPCGLVH